MYPGFDDSQSIADLSPSDQEVLRRKTFDHLQAVLPLNDFEILLQILTRLGPRTFNRYFIARQLQTSDLEGNTENGTI